MGTNTDHPYFLIYPYTIDKYLRMCYAKYMIGIDFYDTITENPPKFRKLVRDLKGASNTVLIISAIHEKNKKRLESDFKRSRIRAELVPVYYSNYRDVPGLKLAKCRELGIKLMIDDRKDTCDLLQLNGIKTIHYRGQKLQL